MRVLYVIHGPVFGGAHNQLELLAKPLAKRGFESLAVLPTQAEQATRRLNAAGVEATAIPLGRVRATINPAPHARLAVGLWPDLRRLRRLIREHEVDIVQVHGPTNPHGALAARSAGRAVVWQLLDTRAPLPLRRLAMPAVVRLADAITSWGEALIHMHPGAERLGDRAIAVYPPVDLCRFAPDRAARQQARERLAVPGRSTVVGSVGVLNPQKGHELMLRAAVVVADRHPEASFRILGAPSPAHAGYQSALRREASGVGLAAARLGFVDPKADVPSLIQALDVFTLTSVARSEGMPTAILEAMAASKPVVATRVGAVAELVEDGVTGLLARPGDVAEIATCLDRLLSDGDLRAEMGAAGRRRAEAMFGLDRLADLHAGAYAVAIDHARARRRARTPP